MSSRVLVFSHNAFSKTQNNGKTLESFFQQWDKDKLAQLYLQPETPDFSFCHNYYCMSDYEVLNFYLAHGKIGHPVEQAENDDNMINLGAAVGKLYTQKAQDRGNRTGLNAYIHKKFVNRSPAFVLAREIMWKHAAWNSDQLTKWIKQFNPNILFFQGSSCCFAYEVAQTICTVFQIPLILELTDDYTYYTNKLSPFEWINKHKYLKALQYGIQQAKSTITISSYMKDEYSHRFGGNYTVMLNAVSDPMIPSKTQEDAISMIYAGNISINRWKTLLAIGLALDIINRSDEAFSVKLYVYTPNKPEDEILHQFAKSDSIVFGGSLNTEEIKDCMKTADYLVHVESFDKKMRQITRLSISTKIPEYLAANRCIFAVGPTDVASMKYLSENHVAITSNSSDPENIAHALLQVLQNHNSYELCVANARNLFKTSHRSDDASSMIESIIERAVGDHTVTKNGAI